MTHEQAKLHALSVLWKTYSCGAENCWCAMIGPKQPLVDDDDNEIWIAGAGSVSKEHAEHIVNLHNQSLSHD